MLSQPAADTKRSRRYRYQDPFPHAAMNKTTLHWSYLNIKDVPMDLYLYEQLEEVYLKENFISVIPNWMLNVTTLKFIHMSGNNLTSLPDELYFLECLEFLDVSNNNITKLPETIGLMLNLQRLNVSGNQLTELPATFATLKRLESLILTHNKLIRLPIQLSECCRMNELNISDNPTIWHIPDRIASMPSLQSLAADRCSLAYLPVGLSKFIYFIRIFHNLCITHVPMIYEKFFQTFYENRMKPLPMIISRPDFFWVLEKETNTKLLLPIGTRQIFRVPNKACMIPLYDLCLRAAQHLFRYEPPYENLALEKYMPESFMKDHVINGPTGRCTWFVCSGSLFTSYYFMVVKRRNSSSKQIFTCNYCSHFCAMIWLQYYSKDYYQVDWEVVDT